MTTPTVSKPRKLHRHRIIERPRLYALLDGTTARVKTLVAPAGYGKSTLAEQWSNRDGRQGAWFTARRSATDVAALALGLAHAAKLFLPDCDERLREHLRALPAPAENVETLAEILGEDLAAWPPNAWLVVDEYQEVTAGRDAERFVAALIAYSPLRLLVSSRTRPAWTTDRSLLYGEVSEIGQDELAMDPAEAAEVLSSRSVESASGLVAIANGWPAVIGLAGVSTAEVDDETAQVPESLYRFFAHEVFAALGDAVQTGLTTLAATPILDRELAARLLGDEEADTICTAALHVGVLVERDAKLELHPLARSFLEERGEASGVLTTEGTIACCFDYYWEHRDWDAAFELISRHELGERFEPLLTTALDELLDTARLSTIDTWCERASEEAIDGPIVSIARAEVALRHGRHAEAQAQAERAAAAETEHVFRALSVAGRAAHLASREEDGLDLYRRAEAAATTDTESRDAQWGQLRCLIDLESPDAPASLSALLSGVRLGDPRDVVQAEAHRLHLGLRIGIVDLDGTEVAEELLESVHDPLVRSSFLSALAASLALAAKYSEALDAADNLLAISEKYRLNFARPYGLCMEAIARAGLRQWSDAEAAATEAMDLATATRDTYAEHVSIGALLRVLTQQGRHQAALAVETSHLRRSLPSACAELACSRALALAVGGRTDEARRAVSSCAGTTLAIEPVVLAEATLAIGALKDGDADAPQFIAALEARSFSSGALDLLVVAYRACPELLSVLLRLPNREHFHALMRRVGDDDLAQALGHSVRAEANPMSLLSPRELEVAQLIGQGLTNRQIANVLFISESTVKRHAHNIYAKLGTSSRRALVVHAALQRSDQATSATEGADSSA